MTMYKIPVWCQCAAGHTCFVCQSPFKDAPF